MKNTRNRNWLFSLKTWHIVLIGCIASEVLTFIFSTLSLHFLPDKPGKDATATLYMVGSLDAFAVAFFVILLILYIRSLYERQLKESQDETLRINQNLEMANQALGETVKELALAREKAIENERLAQSSNKAKSTFLANMSHELRTPLNAIIGYSELIRESAEEDGHKQYCQDTDKILSSAHHLLNLINALLDLSKIEAGKMELFIESIDVSKLIHDLSTIVTPLAGRNHNHFTCQVDDELTEIFIDEIKIRQSLLNLLSNAFKFTSNGTVTLEVKSRNKQFIDFTVSDSGIGMTEEQLLNIFGEFTQAEDSTSRHYGGSGLGLTITQRFARLMGGDVTVTSEYGKGSIFTISIPCIGYH